MAYRALVLVGPSDLFRGHGFLDTGSPTRHRDKVGDNHDHVICHNCGRPVDVDRAVGGCSYLTAADD